jgi:hypothetical protein
MTAPYDPSQPTPVTRPDLADIAHGGSFPVISLEDVYPSHSFVALPSAQEMVVTTNRSGTDQIPGPGAQPTVAHLEYFEPDPPSWQRPGSRADRVEKVRGTGPVNLPGNGRTHRQQGRGSN